VRTAPARAARILHASARYFVLCSARKDIRGTSPRPRLLILLEKLVLPDRIELSTSPLPMECSTTELRQRAPDTRIGQKAPQGGPILATRPPAAQARDKPLILSKRLQSGPELLAARFGGLRPTRFPFPRPAPRSAGS
jgi:hypothetical protein